MAVRRVCGLQGLLLFIMGSCILYAIIALHMAKAWLNGCEHAPVEVNTNAIQMNAFIDKLCGNDL